MAAGALGGMARPGPENAAKVVAAGTVLGLKVLLQRPEVTFDAAVAVHSARRRRFV